MAPPAVVSNGAAGITTVKSAPVTGRISTVYSEVQITRSLFLLLIALLLAIQMKLPSCSHACLDSLPGDGKGLGSGQNLKMVWFYLEAKLLEGIMSFREFMTICRIVSKGAHCMDSRVVQLGS